MASKPVTILLPGEEPWEHRKLSLTHHHGSLRLPVAILRRGKLRLEALCALEEVIKNEIAAYHIEWASYTEEIRNKQKERS
jgi:hypothetical protein